MTADSHHTRSHSVWSASATARNSVCAGAIAMSSLCEDVEREAAAWGTCCHEAAERCFREQRFADSLIGETFKVGKFEFVFDAEMAATTQTYLDYVWETSAYGLQPLFIEQHFSLTPLSPPLEAGGTADAVIYSPEDEQLEVVDLKAGRGVTVDVVGNPQGRTYAIGALLKFDQLKVSKIKVTIVQPRVGDGLPKSDEFHIVDLLDWTHDLLKLMQRAKDALDEFEACGGGLTKEWSDEADPPQWVTHVTFKSRMLFDEWADKWLTPGQCTFCTAKPICPALRKKALAAMPEIARKWHEDVALTTPPSLTNLAKIGSVEELEHDLAALDELDAWSSARRAYAKRMAEQGVTFKGWMLVDSVGHRKYIEKDPTKLAHVLRERFYLSEDAIYQPREVKSPSQIEKSLKGEAKKEFMAAEKTLWIKPVTGKNLVRRDKTTRPEAKNSVEQWHETVE